MDSQIAILIFTQEVAKDASRKRLTFNQNKGLNQYIFRQLNNRINSLAGLVGLPVIRSSELNLGGGSFGKKLTNAIVSAFDKGYSKVICIGNDCPALNQNSLNDAIASLEKYNSVLGPDTRGGAYLIGVSKENFDAERFEKLLWQDSRMLNSFLENIDTEACILPTLSDIHSYQNLKFYHYRTSFVSFLLRLIEPIISRVAVESPHHLLSRFFSFKSLRAPPQVS
ncbi:MAG: DUF2064 domain-containing protein [Spirosomataceae bacterium]